MIGIKLLLQNFIRTRFFCLVAKKINDIPNLADSEWRDNPSKKKKKKKKKKLGMISTLLLLLLLLFLKGAFYNRGNRIDSVCFLMLLRIKII